MFSSLLPDADAIDLWATQRLAEAELPRLVRRLITSTTRPTWIDMNAGTAVRFPGLDGTLSVETGNTWVPDGESRWEIGAGSDPGTKANSDYDKRTAQTREAERKALAFVFVSAKNWQGRDAWQAAKQATGEWAEVRALDAQSLESWLDASPKVHIWLSEKMNSAIPDVRSLEDWWAEWSDCYPHHLPARVLLARREVEAISLIHWVDANVGKRVIEAETQDEAIAFVAAALQSGESDLDDRFMRAVVVRTAEAWRQVIRVSQPLILIAEFGDPWVGGAVQNGHHVIIPSSPADQIVADMQVAATHPDDLLAGLEEMGFDPKRAQQVVDDAGGNLRQLRRRLSNVEDFRSPPWSRGEQALVLVPALLAQSWDAASDGDQAMLAQLAGGPYEDLEADLTELAELADPPVRRRGSVWVLAARDDAWRLLLGSVSPDGWERFIDTAAHVLGAPDPAWDLPPDQRWAAAIYDKSPAHSDRLRRGFANSVAMLGGWRHARDLGYRLSGPEVADAIVARLLDPINEDVAGARWAAIGQNLPLIAEAAPERFLGAVEDGLEGEAPALGQLMSDAEAGGIFGRVGHAGVLWGLEALAWSPTYLVRTAEVLARWSALDPGGKWANRPSGTFRGIFLPWHHQTAADIEQRIAALEAVRRAEPVGSWPLLLSLTPERLGSIGMNTHAPRWRTWQPAGDVSVPMGDYWRLVRAVVDWLLADAGPDGSRWVDLVELWTNMPDLSLADRIVEGLGSVDPASMTPAGRESLVGKLRETIAHHLTYADTDWALPRERVAMLEPLAERFAPDDIVLRVRWLFEVHPDLATISGNDIASYDDTLDQRRQAAVQEVLADGGWDSVERLCESASYPRTVGWTLGRLEGIDEDVPLGWADSESSRLRAALSGFFSARARRIGWAWVEDTIEAHRKIWSVSQTAEALLASSESQQGWEFAAALGPDVERSYWLNFAGYPQAGNEPWQAAAKLVEFGRPFEALERIGWERDLATEHFDADLLYAALLAGVTADVDDVGRHAVSSLEHNLPAILDALDAAGFDQDKVAQIEWAYLPLTEHSAEPAKRLGRLLANDPAFFVQMVSAVWRPEGQAADAPDDQTIRLAKQSYNLLRMWRTPPGLDDKGDLDADALANWVHQARTLLADAGRLKAGDLRIGHVLWWSPLGSDGLRPHEAVRDLIDEIGSEEIESGFYSEGANSRGTVWRSAEGGSEEREIAAGFSATAVAMSPTWPRTGEIFSHLARFYEALAKREDDEAALRSDDMEDA